LKLQDLLDNPEAVQTSLFNIIAVNRRGDMTGHGVCGETGCELYLLKRISAGHYPAAHLR
jgi:hypothetical protein